MRRQTPAFALLCLVAALVAVADDPPPPRDLERTVDGTVEIRQATQREKERWSEERAQLLVRYETAQAAVDYLNNRRDLEARKVAALEERIAELERRLEESARLEAGLQDSLDAILRRLEARTQADLPFLPDERTVRLSSLRAELARPDVSAAEKLRRLLEALQIEARYGSTVEIYQDRIAAAGDSLHVDLLRVGRLSVFWRTPDGDRVGEYDRASGEWVELPEKHKRAIARAIEMVSHRRSFDLIALPLGRINP